MLEMYTSFVNVVSRIQSLIGLLASFSFAIVNAQDAPVINTPTQQVGPSPTVATLGRYGGVELKRSTGGISKNISLFQLHEGAIQYNPSIDYYSTGVQVDEWGGNLGIGWSDNFTATIRRTVGTIPDEYSNERVTVPVYEYFQSPATQEKYDKIIAAQFNENLANGTNNSFDPQYDIFSFNLFGKTGQFVIVNNNAVLLTHTQKTKIEILSTSPTYTFCLTDINGFKYFFQNEIEYTSLGIDGDVTPEIATAWFINRMVSPLNDELMFTYSTMSYACKRGFSQNLTFKAREESGDFVYTDPEYLSLYDVTQNSYSVSKTHIATKNLLAVNGDNFKLSFGYISRSDLIGGKLLQEIVLTDEQDHRVSKVLFDYSTYTASTQFENPKLVTDDDLYPWTFGDGRVRYFLSEVKIGTDLFPDEKVHSLFYANPQNLPPRFSLSQDEGGYFNALPNEWFIPKSHIEDYIDTNPMIWDFPMSFTGDRKSTEAAKTGILNKIVYPTGGVDSIEYELNSYTTMIEDETITTYSGEVNNLYSDGDATWQPEEFDWVACDRAEITLDWDVYDPATGISDQDESGNHFAWFYIIDSGSSGSSYRTFYVNGVARDSIQLGIYASRPMRVVFENNIPGSDMGLLFKLHGRYTRVMYELNCSLIDEHEGDLPLPGLRVKQVTTKSHSSPNMVKRYDYRQFTVQNGHLVFLDHTSSHSAELSDAYIKRIATRRAYELTCAPMFYYDAYSSSQSALNIFNGSSIAYSSIVEIQGETFTASLFRVAIDEPGWAVYGDEFFLAPRENSAWYNGLEEKRYYGTWNSSNYPVVKEQQWEYSAVQSLAVENCDFFRRYSSAGERNCGGLLTYEPFTIISYSLWTLRYNLESLKEILYGSDGQTQMSSTVNYTYNINGLVTGEQNTDSKGYLVARTLRYPTDINTGTYLSMSQVNLLNYPIEETTRVNGNVVGSKLTTYRTDNGIFVPDKLYTAEMDEPLNSFFEFNGSVKDPHYGVEPQVDYSMYNGSGRIVKTKDRQCVYTYYVWGYNDSYPVAKIESSENTTIPVSVDDNNFSNSDVSSDVYNDINYLRSLLSTYVNNSEYLVSIYTYKPMTGMASQTDPNGVTVYYEYDDLGRLAVIKDHNENILKIYTYSFAGSERTPGFNYVKTRSIQAEGLYTVVQADSWGTDQIQEVTSYYDGLGRPFQDVIKRGSQSYTDVVSSRIYDGLGRDSLTYLPYTDGSTGGYKSDALRGPGAQAAQPLLEQYRTGKQFQFYQHGGDLPEDDYPYVQKVFEANPLNRISKQGAPGEAWQPDASLDSYSDRSIKWRYEVNKAEDVVLFQYDAPTEEINPTLNGVLQHYQSSTLHVTRTFDEHNNEVMEYVDKKGLIILKRVQYEAQPEAKYAETYYIYDELDNLVVVLPPAAVEKILAPFLD